MTNDFPKLETENLQLRELQRDDLLAIRTIFSDPQVTKYHVYETTTGLEKIDFIIQSRLDVWYQGQGIPWVIIKKDEQKVIGCCAYVSIDNQNRESRLVYELASQYWRQGIMTEALTEVIDFGFKSLQLNRVEAFVMTENIASSKLLEKLDFSLEGVSREKGFWKRKFHDLKLFSLLAKDYQLKNKTL
ncbi:MAG: GNAT family protein [Spirulinaceae cyanobacterium]